MADIKIGKKQFNQPAPLGYRRFSNAMIMFIIPGAVGLVQGWGLSDSVTNRWLLVLSFVPAVIKGLGTFLGNGQEYNPSNKEVDESNSSQ